MKRSLICLIFAAGALFAADQFPKPVGHMNDFAHMFSAGAVTQLEGQLAEFEKQTTDQVAVVTVDSIGDNDIADYTNRLFREWGIGQKDKNNGVLIFFSKNDRKSRIEVGRGLEGALPDATCKSILGLQVRPQFQGGNFDAGVSVAVASVLAAVRGEFVAPTAPVSDGLSLSAWFIIIVICVIVIVVIIAVAGNSGGSFYSSDSGVGGGFGGGGDSGGGSSDFGGFGGGDSGGGGASDGW